jgi:hypothetical protein
VLLACFALAACAAVSPVAGWASSGAAPSKAKKYPKVRTRTETSTSTSEGPLSAVATCPKHSRAVGGGFNAGFRNNGGGSADLIYLSESRRLNGDKNWAVSGLRLDNSTQGDSLDLTAYVRCRVLTKAERTRKAAASKGKRPFKVKGVSQSAEVGAGPATVSATATCPKGTRAVGGGFDLGTNTTSGPATLMLPVESRRAGARSWTATGYDATPSPRTITTYAYCARAKVTEATRSEVLPGPRFSTAISDASGCPKGGRVASGGFTLQVSPLPPSFLAIPIVATPFRSGWRTTALQAVGSSPNLIKSYAYCIR